MTSTRLLSLVALTGLLAGAACGRSPVAPTGASPAVSTAAGATAAKGGGKPPSLERPVTAELRCAGDGCADRLRSDGAPYEVMIGGDGNLAFSLANAPDRLVQFDFSDCIADCAGGNRWFTTTHVGAANDLWMHTSVLVPGTENETPQGLHDIPVGATWFSRIKILFRVFDPAGAEFAWAIRFNPFFQGSTNLQVTRASEQHWWLDALPSQTAWTQSALVTKKRGGAEPVFEGNFAMPFRMTITLR
jgi:hypothetical protein